MKYLVISTKSLLELFGRYLESSSQQESSMSGVSWEYVGGFSRELYKILVPGMELLVNLVTREIFESVEAAGDENVEYRQQKFMNEVTNCLPLWLKWKYLVKK